MTFVTVAAGVARVAGSITGLKASYVADPSGQPGVTQAPADIPDAPVALTRYDTFSYEAGSPEVITHNLVVEFWCRARTTSEGEAQYLPMVWELIAQFRSHVGVFGQGQPLGKVMRGGPPRAESVNEQPFVVFPVAVQVKTVQPQAFTLGPSS